MHDFFLLRRQRYQKKMMKYMRYVLNDHFVLVCLLYYAYVQFTENSNAQDQEKNDDPVDDFNLREAIQELQEMQKKILGTLSENVY